MPAIPNTTLIFYNILGSKCKDEEELNYTVVNGLERAYKNLPDISTCTDFYGWAKLLGNYWGIKTDYTTSDDHVEEFIYPYNNSGKRYGLSLEYCSVVYHGVPDDLPMPKKHISWSIARYLNKNYVEFDAVDYFLN